MLTTKLTRGGGKVTIALKGTIDEGCGEALDAALARIQQEVVTVDLEGVEGVNSIGYRVWLSFLKRLRGIGPFDLVNCQMAFLDYASLVPTLSYLSSVASIVIPYRCNACRAHSKVSYEVDALSSETKELETQFCEKCNGICEATVELRDVIAALGR
jgi:hypothetical protein